MTSGRDAVLYRSPPHPGLTLRDDILPALNLQVGEAAGYLMVSADQIAGSNPVAERVGLAPA
jgi:plasmid maintenance system antidote protein VapI